MTTAASFTLPLSPGAVWRGRQTSGQLSYDVEVRICGVDEKGDVCGTLTIRNLTPSLPKLVTYFDGEVIGDHHSLITDKWGATEEDDLRHWSRFKHDLGISGVESLDAELPEGIVFMRLKERCILNNNNGAQDTSGASLEGFYYIAIQLNPSPSFSENAQDELFSKKMLPVPIALHDAMSTSKPTQSLLSESLRATRRASHGTSLIGVNSYASVVRGDSSTTTPVAESDGSSASLPSKSEEGPASPSMASILAVSPPPPYSPSFEDFPPPSPSVSAQMRSSSYFNSASSRRRFSSPDSASSTIRRSMSTSATLVGHGRKRSTSALSAVSLSYVVNASTDFYNALTGYEGPWAHAVMRGFYFATSSDPYQEFRLHYVGDGLGVLLEENDEEIGGVDEWGNIQAVDEEALLKKETARRQKFAQPRGLATFRVL